MRAFIALPLPEPVRAAIDAVAKELATGGAGGFRWVPRSQIHLTLKFLGEIDDSQAPAVSDRLATVAGRLTSWPARLGALGAFPGMRSPRVIWIGVEDNGESVAAQRAVEDSLAEISIPREPRAFTAHLTLGRRRPGGRFGSDFLQRSRVEPVTFTFDRLILFQSTLTPSGAVHREISVHPLGGR